ncbi:ABC transporter G family member 3-like protein, partial [Drosera capensis]
DDQGDLSSVNMDTAVAIRTLEATYKSSPDAASVETTILKLTERTRVAAIFVFVSFTSLLSIAGVPAHTKEIKIYASEEHNRPSGALVFLLGQLFSSIPFLFLISVSSSVVFYFLIGLRNEFSLLMYFVLNFFMCLLACEDLMLLVACFSLDVFWSILTLVCIHLIMTLSSSYFRIRSDLPEPGLLENEHIGMSYAVGQGANVIAYGYSTANVLSLATKSTKSESKLELSLVRLRILPGHT